MGIANANSQTSQSQQLKSSYQDSIYNFFFYKTEQRKNIQNELLKRYKETNDEEILAFIEILKYAKDIDSHPENQNKLLELARKYKAFPSIQARCFQIVGYHNFVGTLNYEKAFNAYLRLEKLLEIYDKETITGYANYYSEIATAYYRFRNYKKAIELGKRGLPAASNKWDFYNTIGLCYTELHQLDSSTHYLQKAIVEAEAKKMPNVYRTISMGNIGNNYYLQKKYTQAKSYIHTDLAEALKIDDKGLAAGAAIPLAAIYLAEKNWKVADTLLNQARKHIALSKQLNRLEKFFPIRSRYYQLTGNPILALAYRDSAIAAIKQNDSVFNSLLVMRLQQRSDMERLAEEKNKLESYKKLSQTRLFAISAVFILVIVVFIIIRHYRNRIEKDRERIEELNRIMALRQRLSADMHDDIGSTLSSISIYAHSLLLQQPQIPEQKNILEKIKQSAQSVQENISDIIWSVNPQMDSMEQMLARMRAFGADMSEYAGITFDFIADEGLTLQALDIAVKRNLYLIYKEAINNAVKYSLCKKIEVSIKINQQNFSMQICDDGQGFDTSKKQVGNGMGNMDRRASEINAKLVVDSKLNVGTKVNLNIPLNENS
ncbi:Oxygen sensor histidine kinase NreB [compost metagenome]